MKIGIISSGRDTLSLFKFLSRYDNEYLVYVDQEYFPYWEKSLNSAIDRIQKAGEFLIKKWAESIIVDPIYELSLKYLWKDINFNVLPLFQKYLIDYGFKYSLVWKIWVLTDFWSLSQVQELLVKEEKWYTPNSEQMKRPIPRSTRAISITSRSITSMETAAKLLPPIPRRSAAAIITRSPAPQLRDSLPISPWFRAIWALETWRSPSLMPRTPLRLSPATWTVTGASRWRILPRSPLTFSAKVS